MTGQNDPTVSREVECQALGSAQGEPGHLPVLLDPVLAALAPTPGACFVDLTAGRGGHAEAVARILGPSGRVILFDLDPGNLAFAAERVARLGVPAV